MTAKELQDRFSFSYGERDQSYTFVLYGRNQSPAVGFTLSFRDRVMRAQEFVQSSIPPKKWEPKPGSSYEKYYLKDHEFSDLYQLEQMMNNLTRFLNYDMIDFNQKLFNEESRKEILRQIIKDANWRGLYKLNRLTPPVLKRNEISDSSCVPDASSPKAAAVSPAAAPSAVSASAGSLSSAPASAAQSPGAVHGGSALSASTGSTADHSYRIGDVNVRAVAPSVAKQHPGAAHSSSVLSASTGSTAVHGYRTGDIPMTAGHKVQDEEGSGFLGYFFSFKGRLGRRAFFWRTMLAIVLAGVILFGLAMAYPLMEDTLQEIEGDEEMTPELFVTAMAVLEAFVLGIIGLSLCARRARDAGIGAVSCFLALVYPINFGYFLVLLLFPTKKK